MLKVALIFALLLTTACAGPGVRQEGFAVDPLSAVENAFSQSMQDRDFEAFAAFIADDAVFINGGKPLRGKQAILNHWKAFFTKEQAPFSWRPEIVELGAGNLGYTEGPVLDPANKPIARFYSVWQLQPDGRWLVVFDNGYDRCAN